MKERLRLMEREARNLTDVHLLNAERIGALKSYVDELLEETAALFTIPPGACTPCRTTCPCWRSTLPRTGFLRRLISTR